MQGSERKTVVVTGGAQGIGKGIADRCARSGMAVVIADIDADAGRETAEELSALGSVHFVPTDVSREPSVEHLVTETIEKFGRIDGLVCNAGIANPRGSFVGGLALEEWQRVLDTNLTGPLLCVKHAAAHLKATRGSVVNIASTRALQSEPNGEAYVASKAGLIGLTHALAMSLGPEVRVNCISPGWIDVGPWKKSGLRSQPAWSAADHAQHPVGRVGIPEDIAGLVAFLLGSESGFITGQNFVVDGGMTRKMCYV